MVGSIGKLFLHDDGKTSCSTVKATLILLADDQSVSSGSRGEDRSPESGESQGTSAGLTGYFFNPYRPVSVLVAWIVLPALCFLAV